MTWNLYQTTLSLKIYNYLLKNILISITLHKFSHIQFPLKKKDITQLNLMDKLQISMKLSIFSVYIKYSLWESDLFCIWTFFFSLFFIISTRLLILKQKPNTFKRRTFVVERSVEKYPRNSIFLKDSYLVDKVLNK